MLKGLKIQEEHFITTYFSMQNNVIHKSLILTGWIVSCKLLKLRINWRAWSLIKKSFLGDTWIFLGVDHRHVDVDGVDPGDAEADPHLVALQVPALHLLLRHLCWLSVEELHEAPVLDDSVLHGDLTVGRVLDCWEDVPEGGHVSVLRRKIVNIETLAVEGTVAHMTTGQPINL